RVTVHHGDPRSASELATVLPGHDAVLSALGPPGPGPTTILRLAARSVVEAMQAANVRRLLVVSAAVLFADLGMLGPLLRRLLRQTLVKNVARHSAERERSGMASGLEWTTARPPRLTNGGLSGRYRIEEERLPGGSAAATISRADVAHFLLDEVERPRHTHHI